MRRIAATYSSLHTAKKTLQATFIVRNRQFSDNSKDPEKSKASDGNAPTTSNPTTSNSSPSSATKEERPQLTSFKEYLEWLKSNPTHPSNQQTSPYSPSPSPSPSSSSSSHSTTTASRLRDQTWQTLNYAGHAFDDLEQIMMKRLNENNRRRFRFYFFGSIITLFFISTFFGSKIRKVVSDQTADIAKETLENKHFKVQTQELAVAVVHTILNDPEITAQAAKFLKEASTAEETQIALLGLVIHILQHPQSIIEVKQLGIKLIQELSIDQVGTLQH
jgi:hypothetical protein